VGTRREKTGIGWKERKEGAECAMRKETIEHNHVEWMYRNEREGEKRKGRNTE
jgi:hypothetical protein